MRAIYSDIGLILLGMSIERLTGLVLGQVVHQCVAIPLELKHTSYRPISTLRVQSPALDTQYLIPSIAPTELCAWRNRRIVGEVHDENAAALGGVAGHAGIFSTAADTARLGQMYLDRGAPLLSAGTVAEMTRVQAEDGMTRRGLGFALWCADPEASGNPFSPQAFGHTGFTGTSLWIDPERDLVVACLTNRVYYGRNADGILAFRVALHRAIVEALGHDE
jgi:CubicO group peptidase (beta-lactamase class C family)